ncbi:hypothetical protein PCE1_002472 [Barthelona sp. PCE]
MDIFQRLCGEELRYDDLFRRLYEANINLALVNFQELVSIKAQRIYLDLSISKKGYEEVYQIGLSTRTSWIRKYVANLFKTRPKFFHHIITRNDFYEVFSAAPQAFRTRIISQLIRYGKHGCYSTIADSFITNKAWSQLLNGNQLHTLYVCASPSVAKDHIWKQFIATLSIPIEFVQPRFYDIVYNFYLKAIACYLDKELYSSSANHIRFNSWVLSSRKRCEPIFRHLITIKGSINCLIRLFDGSSIAKCDLPSRVIHMFAVQEPVFFCEHLFSNQKYHYSKFFDIMPYFIKYHNDDVAMEAFEIYSRHTNVSMHEICNCNKRGYSFSTDPNSLFVRILECVLCNDRISKLKVEKKPSYLKRGHVFDNFFLVEDIFTITNRALLLLPQVHEYKKAVSNQLYELLENERYWKKFFNPTHFSGVLGHIIPFITLDRASLPQSKYNICISGKTHEVSHIMYLFVGNNGLLHIKPNDALFRLLQRFICTGDWSEWNVFQTISPHILKRIEGAAVYIRLEYDLYSNFYNRETVDNITEYFMDNIDHRIIQRMFKYTDVFQCMVNHKLARQYFPLEDMQYFFDKMMEVLTFFTEKVMNKSEEFQSCVSLSLKDLRDVYISHPYRVLPHYFERGRGCSLQMLEVKRKSHDRYNKPVNYVSDEMFCYVMNDLIARQSAAGTDDCVFQQIFSYLVKYLNKRSVWNYTERKLYRDNQKLIRMYTFDQYLPLCNGNSANNLKLLHLESNENPGATTVYPIARHKARHKVVKGYQDPLTNSRIITRSDFVSKMYRISSVYDIPNVERFDSLAIQVRDEIAHYFDPLDKLFGLYTDLEELDRDISEMSDRDIEDEEAEAEYKEMLQSRRDLVESISDLINSTLDVNEINNMLRTLQLSLRFSTTFLNEEFVKRIIGFTHLSNRAFTNSNILELFKRVIFILGRIMCLTDLSFAEMARSALLTALTIPKSAPFVRTLLEGYVMHTSVEEQKRLFDDLIALAYSDEWRFGITPMKMIIGVVQALSRQNAGVNPAAFLKVMWDQETMAVDVRLVLLNFAVDQISLMLNKGWSDSVFESEYWQLVGLAARRFYGVVVIVERIVEFITFLYNKIGTEHWNDAFNCVVGHWLCPIMEKEFRDTRTDYKNVEIVLNSIINASLHTQGYSLVNVSLPDRFLQFCEQYAQPIFRYFSRFTEMICLVFSQRRDSKRLLKMLEPLKDTFRENLTVSIEQHLAKARDRTHQLYVPFLNNNLVAQKLNDVCKYYLKDDIALTREFFRTISTFMLECYNEIDGFHIGEVWWQMYIASHFDLVSAIKSIVDLYKQDALVPHISYNGVPFSILSVIMKKDSARSETAESLCNAMNVINDSELKESLKLRWLMIILKLFNEGGIGFNPIHAYPSDYIDHIPLDKFLRANVSDICYFEVLNKFLNNTRSYHFPNNIVSSSITALSIGLRTVESKSVIEPYIRPIVRQNL